MTAAGEQLMCSADGPNMSEPPPQMTLAEPPPASCSAPPPAAGAAPPQPKPKSKPAPAGAKPKAVKKDGASAASPPAAPGGAKTPPPKSAPPQSASTGAAAGGAAPVPSGAAQAEPPSPRQAGSPAGADAEGALDPEGSGDPDGAADAGDAPAAADTADDGDGPVVLPDPQDLDDDPNPDGGAESGEVGFDREAPALAEVKVKPAKKGEPNPPKAIKVNLGPKPPAPAPAPPKEQPVPSGVEARIRTAWHSMRLLIAEGRKQHGMKAWETKNAPNRGPVIDIIQRAAGASIGTPEKDKKAQWCGATQAYNHLRAGFDPKKKGGFLHTKKLLNLWESNGCKILEFPARKGMGKKSKAECLKWLKENYPDAGACKKWWEEVFLPWGAVPGDLLIIGHMCHEGYFKSGAHITMFAGYDHGKGILTTYEGNWACKGGRWDWRVWKPTLEGFGRPVLMGRLKEEMFTKPPQVTMESPEPTPNGTGG